MNKAIFRFLALLLAALLLTACSGGANEGGQEAEGPPPADAGDRKTLTVMLDSSAVLTNFESPQEAIDAFDNNLAAGQIKDTPDQRLTKENLLLLKKYADENKIDLISVEWGWGNALTQKLMASFLAKEGPDLIIGETQLPGFAREGYLEPFPDELANRIRNELASAAWKPMEFKGKLYGVALEPSATILVWNKKIAKEAGLDPDKAPQSWEELLHNLEAVHKTGKAFGGGFYAGANNGGYLRFGAFLAGSGGSYADKNGQPAIDNSANLAAFQFLRSMSAFNKPGILAAPEEGTFFSAFDKGQLAYKVDGTWAISQAKSQGMDVGASLLPAGPGGQIGGMVIGAGFQAVPAYSKNKEEAFKLIEQLIGEPFQQNIATGGLRIPALKSVSQSQAFKEMQPVLYELTEALDSDYGGLPTFEGNISQVWDAVGEALTRTITTQDPLEEIVKQAQEKMAKAVLAQ